MMNEVTVLENGWIQVKIPLPFSLRWVNSYIIPEDNGFTVIDPGLRTDEAIQLWDDVLEHFKIEWGQITRIVLTHQHPDHYGLAGYIQQKSGCPVYMSQRSHHYALRLWGTKSDYPAALRELYLEHGMPSELMNAIEDNLLSFIEKVSPQPIVSYIEAGSTLVLGGVSWELIDAPGHAYGALCFYQREWGWMICGDQVLPHITPNVSVVPGEERDPLAAFLNSLEELKTYEVKFALPGHRDPFTDFQGRIAELQGHHERRLKGMVEQLSEQPRSAFQLCESLFGIRLRDNPHNLRFAMSETLAHLFYLEERGLVRVEVRDGEVVFFAS
ncbi:MBL fold metallo-hydrolase [Paenibacillus sp. GSMTC-2017]|uniref:MBL fold metallo-hydrolase n=1 Tax=Paenibacillus sp. GSMTC-2017 TaxID=2794350 RepID=UPI0018D9FE85|nr:MBL fold metallo-hydrolase [Paenibacillus sp. GSMTC-2017]MBH5317217.1 MBL fold metallo-hydrolase [Paenibacillus sp. GSMTC-2017]